MRTERIVVGVDFSEPSIRAAEWVARVLAPDADIVLAHVLEEPLHAELAFRDPTAMAPDAGAAARVEQRLHALLRDLGIVRGAPAVVHGAPADALLAVARRHAADVIVVGGHRGRSGLRTWLGGTAERLLATAHVPVLVAAQVAAGAPHRVLAVDDASPAADVLDWTDGLAARFDARRVLMSVADIGAPSLGHPPREVLAAAEECRDGMIVVGDDAARRATMPDDVTAAVVRRAICPVLVVPRELEARR